MRFSSYTLTPTDKEQSGNKLWLLSYTVAEARGYIKTSLTAYKEMIRSSYLQSCKNHEEGVNFNSSGFSLFGAECEGFKIPREGETESVLVYIKGNELFMVGDPNTRTKFSLKK